jgi:putative membrane protein
MPVRLAQVGSHIMIAGPFVALLALVGVIAIIVWLVQWASDYRRSRIALDILNERFARGEIGRDEFEEKRKLMGSRT